MDSAFLEINDGMFPTYDVLGKKKEINTDIVNVNYNI